MFRSIGRILLFCWVSFFITTLLPGCTSYHKLYECSDGRERNIISQKEFDKLLSQNDKLTAELVLLTSPYDDLKSLIEKKVIRSDRFRKEYFSLVHNICALEKKEMDDFVLRVESNISSVAEIVDFIKSNKDRKGLAGNSKEKVIYLIDEYSKENLVSFSHSSSGVLLPPPVPTARVPFTATDLGIDSITYISASNIVKERFKNAGYVGVGIQYIQDFGLILSSGLERFNSDGTSYKGSGRFKPESYLAAKSLREYIRGFLFGNEASYRLLMVIITTDDFIPNDVEASEQALSCYLSGLNSLPLEKFSALENQKDVKVFGFVYEFEKSKYSDTKIVKNSDLPAIEHFKLAKIIEDE